MLKRILLLVICVYLIFSPSATFAEGEEKYGKEYDECMEKAGWGDLDMRACVLQEMVRWEEKANLNYKKIIVSGKVEEKKELDNLKKLHEAQSQYKIDMCVIHCLDFTYCGTLGKLSEAYCELKKTIEYNEGLENFIEMRID